MNQAIHNPSCPLFVVGVGASAGGLEALQELFANAKTGTAVSYVVIQHLSPDFKSMMVELLSRQTQLQVKEAEDGSVPEPDTIHLIPPKRVLELSNGKFVLSERSTAHPPLPINVFLRSLGDEQGDQCAAIILSGTGTDGTHGLAHLKEAGGLVMAQEPTTAKFDGMLNSAINSGLVDFVGAPEKLMERLGLYIRHPLLGRNDQAARTETEREAFTEIISILRQSSRLDFASYKEGTMLRRVRRRASLVGIETLTDYLDYLRSQRSEVEVLTRELLIGVTRFFRDSDPWDAIETTILPQLIADTPDGGTVRLWSAGCSTGEEAYTLALLVQEQIQRVDKDIQYRLFATDARADSLTFARAGMYPLDACEAIPESLRRKYFDVHNSAYVVKRSLRDKVTFAHHDVLSDPPFTQLNFISCRNLLIYLNADAQKRAFTRFRMSLKDGGYLFLGTSESVGDANPQFRSLNSGANVYVARGSVHSSGALFSPPHRERVVEEMAQSSRAAANRSTEMLYQAVMSRYVPPGVAVDGNFELIQIFGDGASILRVPRGRMSTSLLKMVPQSVSVLLNSAGRKALNKGEEVRIPDVKVELDRQEKVLSIRIVPVGDLPTVSRGLLIFFEDENANLSKAKLTDLDVDSATRQRLIELEEELVVARENLHSAVQDQEATNEELQATNEELTASNEELQSTNEELQSVNEELYTVNTEYQQKIGELEELNADLENLLRVLDAGVLFLDENLHIRRFNDSATRLFPMRYEDVGRPFREISMLANYPGMFEDATAVARTGEKHVETALGDDGAWWQICMRVFKVSGPNAPGVIVTMQEVSELKHALSDVSRLKRAHDMAEGIGRAGHIILDLTRDEVFFSGGARRLLQIHTDQPEGLPVQEALGMFSSEERAVAERALQALKSGLEVPFTAIREVQLPDGTEMKVRLSVQGRKDVITEDRLIFAVFQQLPE